MGKSLDLETKSPLFSFFKTTISGIHSIRVYQQNEAFYSKMLILCDNSFQAHLMFQKFSRVFSFFIDFVTNVANCIGIFIIIHFSLKENNSEGNS